MLDECKGDKFEEVLAVFSTNVVRKFLSKNGGLVDNTATALSTASYLTSTTQDSLLPLVLAHRVSLGSILADKARLQGYYDIFGQRLDSKAAELSSRPGQTPQALEEIDQDSEAISRAVRGAWFGPEEWADAILHGGIQHVTDNLFESPFEETWSRVNKGDVESSGYNTSPDLLVDLDRRIEQQKGRLHKWQEFRTILKKQGGPQPAGKDTKASSSPLLFRNHQTLTVPTTVRSPGSSAEPEDQASEYKCLVAAMNASLSDLKGDSTQNHVDSNSSRRNAIQREEERPNVTDDPGIAISRSSPPYSLSGSSSQESLPEGGQQTISEIPSDEEQTQDNVDFVHPNITNTRLEKPRPDSWDDNEREEMLDPIKEDAQPVYKDRKPDKPEKPGVETLLQRTRQSMSLLPPQSTGPRQSINPRSSRQSQVFPINQFETPKKPLSDLADLAEPTSGTVTPKEELYDADYASVFKSRPKIATSPVISPAVHMQSLDNIDHSMDFSLSELDTESSPLAKSRIYRSR